jgi:hypothetical protein
MNTTVRIVTNKTTVRFPAALPVSPLAQLQAAVDALDTSNHIYDSDESAAAGGIAIGSLYLTAENHVAAPGGLLIRRLT